MKVLLYKFFIHVFLRLPDVFLSVLFAFAHPIYKILHKNRAYGRVVKYLNITGISTSKNKINAYKVFQSLYWNGIDSYRILARIPSAASRVVFKNEHIIQNALSQGPIIALSIHQGAFENLHRSLCRYSKNVHLITSPFKSESLTQVLQELRADDNLCEYSTQEISKILHSLFKTKGILAMVVDQAHNAKGNATQLFGLPSTLYLRLPIKANQMGAGIVTFRTFCEEIPQKFGKKLRKHIVQFENYYPPQCDKNLLFCLSNEIENWISEHPEQWTWNYHKNFTVEL